MGIRDLTVFALAKENLKRPKIEVDTFKVYLTSDGSAHVARCSYHLISLTLIKETSIVNGNGVTYKNNLAKTNEAKWHLIILISNIGSQKYSRLR